MFGHDIHKVLRQKCSRLPFKDYIHCSLITSVRRGLQNQISSRVAHNILNKFDIFLPKYCPVRRIETNSAFSIPMNLSLVPSQYLIAKRTVMSLLSGQTQQRRKVPHPTPEGFVTVFPIMLAKLVTAAKEQFDSIVNFQFRLILRTHQTAYQ